MQAAEKLKITATELTKLQISDGIIPVMLYSIKISYLDSVFCPLPQTHADIQALAHSHTCRDSSLIIIVIYN